MPITGRSPAVTVPQLPGTGLSLTSGNFVGGRIYGSGGQVIPSATWTTLTLPLLEYDVGPNATGANFVQSGSPNAMVPFLTGVYSLAVSVDAGSAPVSVRPVTSTGNFGYSGTPSGPFGNDYADTGVLSAGDVVTAQVYAPSGATIVAARLTLTLLVSLNLSIVQLITGALSVTTQSLTLTLPKPVTPGNMLFVMSGSGGGTSGPQVLPTGWTAVGSAIYAASNAATAIMGYRVAQAGDSTWTFPNSGGNIAVVVCEVSGITGTPLGLAQVSNATGTPEQVGPVATTAGAPVAAFVGLLWEGIPVEPSFTPAGFTTIAYVYSTGAFFAGPVWLGYQTLLSAPASYTASIPMPGGPGYGGVATTFRVIL